MPCLQADAFRVPLFRGSVPKQVSRERFSSPGWLDGAGERIRTVDIHLGKVTLYH